MKKKIWIPIFDAFLLIFMIFVPTITDIMSANLPKTCRWADIVGVPCPSCGGTRCFRYFFTGRFIDAFLVHPIFFLIIVHILVLVVVLNVYFFKDKAKPVVDFFANYKVIIFWVLVFAAYGLARCLYYGLR